MEEVRLHFVVFYHWVHSQKDRAKLCVLKFRAQHLVRAVVAVDQYSVFVELRTVLKLAHPTRG